MSHLRIAKPINDYRKASLSATCNCLVRFLGSRDHWALFFSKRSWSGCFGERIAMSNHDLWILMARIVRYRYGRCLFPTRQRCVPHKSRNHRSFSWKVSRPSDSLNRHMLTVLWTRLKILRLEIEVKTSWSSTWKSR